MPQPQNLIEPIQLLVEGNDGRNFFEAFLLHESISGVQVQNFGGNPELGPFVRNLSRQSDFGEIVRSIGIIRDAETDAGSAFQSAQQALRSAELPVPDNPGATASGQPSTSIFILPGGDRAGMLETLLTESIRGSAENDCIDEFFRCLETSGWIPKRPDKARAQAFLATQESPGVSVGVAAQRKYWELDHPAFDDLRRYLRSL